jgi:putative transposase
MKYTLLVPIKIFIDKTIKTEYILIDEGIRIFAMGLTCNGVIKMGEHMNMCIMKYLIKINDIQNNPNITNENKRIKQKKYSRIITNMVDELHWKLIKYLTDNYGRIVIGKLSMGQIVKKDKSVLNKMTKQIGLRMRHYVFRQRLIYKCATKGIPLNIMNECYTSIVCSFCGYYKKDLGGNKIYKCEECGMETIRDVQGSRGIGIKALK